jgi:hypothetical protein
MDIIKDFNNLKGWITYNLLYDDRSESIEQFEFENLRDLEHILSERFKKNLKSESNYDDIELIEIHIQDEDNKFHVHMDENNLTGCCHNEIGSDLIDKNYIRQLDKIKNDIERAKNILNNISK